MRRTTPGNWCAAVITEVQILDEEVETEYETVTSELEEIEGEEEGELRPAISDGMVVDGKGVMWTLRPSTKTMSRRVSMMSSYGQPSDPTGVAQK